MNTAKVYEEKIVIPTYGVGKEDKNPMFFEKRVYQGSSGKVYPNPVIEKIYDEKKDVVYDAVILENEWLKVIVLPSLGGRIYTAYDKTNGYDFVYHNKVIKPALVGLLGPWISGGIEFNWPQHHRPSTYMPVNYKTVSYPDGSVAVFVGETEKMFSLEQTTQIRIYPDKSYIEISTNVYNRSPLVQTFLWWANPAYRVNDDTRTIMPPDVSAVMDHGKRAVSAFPISRGEYYKVDYSAGVDISRYKNLPVPTSFMAYRSDFDFVGGYDDGRRAGLLHVADHHISPGKKQWTWGCGDFGQAWDRNLTDEDGPYVELMTGCFTDNQPDFTFIQPQENKTFTQYFMPYHEVGAVKNANKDLCFGYEDGKLTVYSSVYTEATITVAQGGSERKFREKFAPTQSKVICEVDDSAVTTVEYDGHVLSFVPAEVKKFGIPSPATACPEPADCKDTEQLYLYGTHIEQYRHATRLPEDYYLEGLRRDKDDVRLNRAQGLLMLRRGRFDLACGYLEKSVAASTVKNPNPEDTKAYYYFGISRLLLGDRKGAFDALYKCVWSAESKTQALYAMALICAAGRDWDRAEDFARQSTLTNACNVKGYTLLGELLVRRGDVQGARKAFAQAVERDALDMFAQFRMDRLDGKDSFALKGTSAHEAIVYAADLLGAGMYAAAAEITDEWMKLNGPEPMVLLYKAYALYSAGDDGSDAVDEAVRSAQAGKIHFAINLSDIAVLDYLAKKNGNYLVYYYLGNIYYDKRQYDLAAKYWEKASALNASFPTARRNLALYMYNKKHDAARAVKLLEEAFALDRSDSRVLMELYSLYDVIGRSGQDKYRLLKDNYETMSFRDDLYVHYIGHVLENEGAQKAYSLISERKFHPWEGGEGKVTKLYKRIVCALAEDRQKAGDYDGAMQCYRMALTFPHNLGEGKLILDYDNDIWYMMGELARAYGREKEADECYRMAFRGKAVVADDMYYNDNPIEYIYYKALAALRLGNKEVAMQIKRDFKEYSARNKGKHVQIDYFAVSLPDLLVWEQDLDKRNDEFCDYVSELADKIAAE